MSLGSAPKRKSLPSSKHIDKIKPWKVSAKGLGAQLTGNPLTALGKASGRAVMEAAKKRSLKAGVNEGIQSFKDDVFIRPKKINSLAAKLDARKVRRGL